MRCARAVWVCVVAGTPNAELPLRPPARPRYCDAGLVPKFSYDFEKAELLNCAGSSSNDDDDKSSLMIGVIAAAAVAVLLLVFLGIVISRERGGTPMFKPLEDNADSAAGTWG